jgi:hypothetical protein
VLDDVLSDLTSHQKPRKKKRRSSGSSSANTTAAKKKETQAKAKAKAKMANDKLKATQDELKLFKEKFRKHRHKNPDDKLSQEFRSVSSKPAGKMKDEELKQILEQFMANQATKGCERVMRDPMHTRTTREETTRILSKSNLAPKGP